MMTREDRVMKAKGTIGLALGSGAARGLAHIGIIRALAEADIEPDIVCGTSIGALVGASHLAGNLDRLENWARSLSKLDTARFFELDTSFKGLVNKDWLHGFLTENVAGDDERIESLDKVFAAVAADLESGREVWLQEGSLIEAVLASIALPGLFPAIRREGRWLVDGGLVNPVPVSVCRALGADFVIAVNLNGDIVGKHFRKDKTPVNTADGVVGKFTRLVREYAGSLFDSDEEGKQAPSMVDGIAGSFNIMQDRITRSRMAGDPPDVVLAPRLSRIGLLEFYRAGEAIEEGEVCVGKAGRELREKLPGIAPASERGEDG